MGALAATTPARTGTVTSGAAVAATDTISAAILGSRGAFLEIINGNASSDSMTISDASVTPSGASAASNAPSVTNATSKIFHILPQQADPTTGLVTITHSVTTTVTYKLYPLG
jgi:glyceraldehyde-3-phosphate dehydrogenase/erythrose-4-phosphate dehydrogenase